MAYRPKSGGKSKGGQRPPDGELRQSQMITTYGPGSLVDLVADAIVIPGLEHWGYRGSAGYEVVEPRFANELRRRGLKLSPVAPFRRPPVSGDEEQHFGCGIRAVEFPSWFLCPNRQCQRLVHKRDAPAAKRGGREHRCPTTGTNTQLVPVRFVTACVNGHMDDFPWEWFVHAKEGKCGDAELRLSDGGSGDLTDVVLKCETCGVRRPMSEARGDMALPACRGKRPWLGGYVGDPHVAEGDCTKPQKLLLRTASNSYFSQVESALSIPKISRLSPDLLDFFGRHDERDLRKIDSLQSLQKARDFIPVLADGPACVTALSDEALWEQLAQFRAEASEDESAAHGRELEYRSIKNAPEEVGDYLYAEKKDGEQRDFCAIRPRREGCPLPPGVHDLVLLERLREVRVLTGFTRLEASVPNIFGEFDAGSRRAALSTTADWLPASEIRGEGFFLELDRDALAAWEQREVVQEREKQLKEGYVRRYPKHEELGQPFQGIRFYLLHSLAHLLITRVSLDCGYAASSIRERIYCSPPGTAPEEQMAGILLSTGSSGSEGTLGGLVEQGRRVDHHIREALRQAKLCSHDPVCGRQVPSDGTPGRALLGAACHGCLFIAECSCERSNQYLDRALLVPAMGVEDAEQLSFFPPEVG